MRRYTTPTGLIQGLTTRHLTRRLPIGPFAQFQRVGRVCPKNKRHMIGYPQRIEQLLYILMTCLFREEQTKHVIMWGAAMYHRKPRCALFFSIEQGLNLILTKSYPIELRLVRAIRYPVRSEIRREQVTVVQETQYSIR